MGATTSTMTEDYLKLVWKSEERGAGPLATREIAATLGVSASTVSGNLRKLDRDGLVEHTLYRGVTLTRRGREAAVAMVRRHRLIETYLVRRLGYSWDEVHAEAEALEHAVSDLFLRRIDADLGHPTHDPHGDPIPDAEGGLPIVPGSLLGTVPLGTVGTVSRVSDDDPELLRAFDALGIALGTRLRLDRVDHDGSIRVVCTDADGTPSVMLPAAAAASVWLA